MFNINYPIIISSVNILKKIKYNYIISMEQPKKIYIKRNSPKIENKTELHRWYLENCPEYKINAYDRLKTKTLCECGCSVSNRNIAMHKTSYKHDVLLKQRNNNNNNNLIAV